MLVLNVGDFAGAVVVVADGVAAVIMAAVDDAVVEDVALAAVVALWVFLELRVHLPRVDSW